MKNNPTKLAAAGLLMLAATASAMAGSVTQQGETAGLALGVPLSPGFYFVDTSNWGVRNVGGGVKESVGATIPVIVWSTPWKVLGARVGFLVTTSALEVGTTSGIVRTPIGPVAVPATYNESMYNPFIGGSLAWDLGGGLGISYFLGAYIGVSDPLADKSSFFINRGTLSYTANGWNLTASAVVGTALDTVNPVTNPSLNAHPDYLNVDLTATKAFGKWEVGAVGFYSTDLDSVNQVTSYQKQSQFALGGLVGYDWGPLKTQVYLTRDVYEQNYGGYDTRVWGRVVVPFDDPFGPSPGMMYHK
jgi:hypothetical protein